LGSRDGTVVRMLASHQCGLGSILARCHKWVEFVVGLAQRDFLQGLWVSSLHRKTTSANSNSTRIVELHENQLKLRWLPL